MDWQFTTADATTAQTWQKSWWIEAKTESYFYGQGLVSTSEDNAVIVEFKDLEQNQGYQHTFAQVRNLSGAGRSGDIEAVRERAFHLPPGGRANRFSPRRAGAGEGSNDSAGLCDRVRFCPTDAADRGARDQGGIGPVPGRAGQRHDRLRGGGRP
ncbi:hypothetical protein LCGC14_2952050, partial [marine sediment metagenome]